jgi:hypothetical protein
MLIPRELDPVEAGTHMPLPRNRPPPKVAEQPAKGKVKAQPTNEPPQH